MSGNSSPIAVKTLPSRLYPHRPLPREKSICKARWTTSALSISADALGATSPSCSTPALRMSLAWPSFDRSTASVASDLPSIPRPATSPGCSCETYSFATARLVGPQPLWVSEFLAFQKVRREGWPESQIAGPLAQRPARVVGVVVPLPVPWNLRPVEAGRFGPLDRRMAHDRLPGFRGKRAGIVRFPPDWPVVLPGDGADVGHAADRPAVAHHEAVPVPVRQVDDRPLVAPGPVVEHPDGLPRPVELGAREHISASREGKALNR